MLKECAHDVIGDLVSEKEHLEEYMGCDKYGIVPFFHQIEDVVEELGRGRCGTVQKIRWQEKFAAKKEYMLDPSEGDRYFFDVFEHERDVLLALQPLWGKYVPAILFHNPWPSCPTLGLELGTPMPADWSEWSKEEKQQANDAVAAVEERGWIHRDVKGNNFIRLTDEKTKTTSIALI